MTLLTDNPIKHVTQFFTDYIERYGINGAALIVSVELIWAASVLFPVLIVIGALFEFTNAWLSVLPGFIGAFTFLIPPDDCRFGRRAAVDICREMARKNAGSNGAALSGAQRPAD